jgi:hypothetical protein
MHVCVCYVCVCVCVCACVCVCVLSGERFHLDSGNVGGSSRRPPMERLVEREVVVGVPRVKAPPR